MAEPHAISGMMTAKFDPDIFAAVQQRNIEAFTAFGACLAAGAQTLLRRQSELVQGRLNEQLAVAKDMLANANTPDGLSKQLAFAQAQAKKALAETEELAAILSATATDALEILYRRTQESVSEIYNSQGKNGGSAPRAPARSSAKAR